MSNKITCPVCDRSAIETNICPNCQTDLSLVRMLTELPPLETIESGWQLPQWWIVGVLLGLMLVGWGLWVV